MTIRGAQVVRTAPTDDVTSRSKLSNGIAATKTQSQQNSKINQSYQSLIGCVAEPINRNRNAFFILSAATHCCKPKKITIEKKLTVYCCLFFKIKIFC